MNKPLVNAAAVHPITILLTLKHSSTPLRIKDIRDALLKDVHDATLASVTFHVSKLLLAGKIRSTINDPPNLFSTVDERYALTDNGKLYVLNFLTYANAILVSDKLGTTLEAVRDEFHQVINEVV